MITPNKLYTFEEAVKAFPKTDVFAVIEWKEREESDPCLLPKTLFIKAVVTDLQSKNDISRMMVKGEEGQMYLIPDSTTPHDFSFTDGFFLGGVM